MKLDRHEKDGDGTGKYALVSMREIRRLGGVRKNPDIAAALDLLESNGLIQYGPPESESEFFVMKLRDKYSLPALEAYAKAAAADDAQYSIEVLKLAERAGMLSPFCKAPD